LIVFWEVKKEKNVKRWYHEDWHFRIEVLRVGKENKAEECRLGFEPGDIFTCTYETPAGFCPTSFIKIFPSMEIIRCGGDLRNLGGSGPRETKFLCPDGAVLFKITGDQLSESGDSRINQNKVDG
jgi:uncharacterized repeat protein (TIGR04076 family)